MKYPLALPNITDRDIQAVVDVLKTPNLSLGPKLAEFETELARRCGTRHAVGVSSGTAGLHLLIRAMGVREGDEVITTPFSFVASTNCILYERARPVFVDIDPETWNIDARAIESAVTPKARAILAVDVFGQPADYDAIAAIAERHGLGVIEDSCEALGSRYRTRPAGSLGDAGVFGFYPNKQITTGEGGMIVTDDDDLAALCRAMRNQGREALGGWLEHRRLGFNYRISDINCVLGLAQLTRLDEIVARRSERAGWYREILGDEPRVVLQRVQPDVEVSWFVFVIRLSDDYSVDDRDRLLAELRARGIGCSNYFVPIHLQAYMVEAFGFEAGDFPHCESLADRTIALPFHGDLTRDGIADICRELRALL